MVFVVGGFVGGIVGDLVIGGEVMDGGIGGKESVPGLVMGGGIGGKDSVPGLVMGGLGNLTLRGMDMEELLSRRSKKCMSSLSLLMFTFSLF